MSDDVEAAVEEAPPAPRNSLTEYILVTRGPWYGFVFALPVLIGYEVLEFIFKPEWVNGADAILTRFFTHFAPAMRMQVLLYGTLIAGVVCWLLDRGRRKQSGADGGLKLSYFVTMLAESCVYAVCFGSAVNAIRQAVPGLAMGGPGDSPLAHLTMSLGAGIYEELLFRVILLGGLALVLVKLGRVPPFAAWLVATLVSSLVFSLFHYVGAYGDPFSLDSFAFRFVAGAVLATIYAARGFGVVVWTHAIYDILVMFLARG